MTDDVISDVYGEGGVLRAHVAGKDALVASTPPIADDLPTVGRHFLVNTHFDTLTADAAKTRTTAFYMYVSRPKPGAHCPADGAAACGGAVMRTSMFVYHDEWRRTADGWRIARIALYPAQ